MSKICPDDDLQAALNAAAIDEDLLLVERDFGHRGFVNHLDVFQSVGGDHLK